MNIIYKILIKNHVFFVFIILQFISLKLLVTNNLILESNFSKKTTAISGSFFLKEQKIKDYFLLKKINSTLLKENLNLVKKNNVLKKKNELNENISQDSILNNRKIIQAKVLKNSWSNKQNFIITDQGSSIGVKKNMGVIYNNNLVGITYTVSENFATIITLINTNLGGISAKIKKSGHYGSLIWNGVNYKKMKLNDIPKHANIEVGDTIVTSGYTSVFPKNINIGVIEEYQVQENTNFFEISVNLFTDFTNLQHVYIIDSEVTEERKLIEKTLLN